MEKFTTGKKKRQGIKCRCKRKRERFPAGKEASLNDLDEKIRELFHNLREEEQEEILIYFEDAALKLQALHA